VEDATSICARAILRYLARPFNWKWALTPHWGFDAITVPFGERLFMYAVIETGSKQYRVAPGDTIEVESLETEEGKEVTLDRVLFVANDGKFSVGGPTIDKATVVADVVKHIRGPKTIAFKMKRRKGYHRTVGHRQELTVLKIKEIKA
jgi:large subunit ribosomal protein L21